MSIIASILVILLLSATIWLVYIAASAAQDPDNPFGEVEFVISSMALLCCAILISYFALVHIILKPDVTQSSYVVYDKAHQPIKASRKHHSMRWLKTR